MLESSVDLITILYMVSYWITISNTARFVLRLVDLDDELV